MSDEEAIRQLLARFIQLRDDRRFDEWSALFTEDGSFSYLDRRLTGRRVIRDHVAELLRDDRGKHLCVNSIIEVRGAEATVSSDVIKIDPVETASPPAFAVQTMGRYVDRLVKQGTSWLIAERAVHLVLPGPQS